MLAFLIRFRQSILLLILLITSLVFMTMHSRDGKGLRILTSGIFEMSAALGAALTAVADGTVRIGKGYLNLVEVQEENRRLQEKISALEDRVNRMREMEMENTRLTRLLNFRESVPFVMIPARVAGKDFNSWSRTLVIDQGRESGIDSGMAVVRPEGVVGRVLTASPNYALVQLVIDGNSQIPAMFQRTRAEGVVQGRISPECQVKYVNRLADVEVNDIVITSGIGGVYPKGLLIGTVSSVQKQPQGLFQEVTITPGVDFSRLEEVFVVKNTRLPEYQQQLKRTQ